MISNSRENLQAHGTGKNISGDSIVTPRERNDSAFLREKCRPGISPPPPPRESVSRAREERGRREARTREDEGRREKLVAWCLTRARKNRAKETLGTASHVATVATYSRARARSRACVCIYSDWHIVDTEKEKEEGETRRDRITHACVRIIGVKHVSVV